MEKKIRNFVYEVGIPLHLKGYLFLCKSMEIIVADYNKIYTLKKDVYDIVARQCKTTSSRVEKDIRTAIEVGYARHATDDKYAYFTKGKTTNKEYIAKLVHMLMD